MSGDGVCGRHGLHCGHSTKPLKHFLCTKDLYQLAIKKKCGKLAGYKESKDKYNRMLYSCYALYTEYRKLCTAGCGRQQQQQQPQPQLQHRCSSELSLHSATSGDFSFGSGGRCLPADILPADSLPADILPADSLHADILPADSLPADILPAAASRKICVKQHKRRKLTVTHRMLVRTRDNARIWVDIPIALELLLPKVQALIRKVLAACQYVTDPLEVLAELRCCQYRSAQCIRYFRDTQGLRGILRDILYAGGQKPLLPAHSQQQQQRQQLGSCGTSLPAASSQLARAANSLLLQLQTGSSLAVSLQQLLRSIHSVQQQYLQQQRHRKAAVDSDAWPESGGQKSTTAATAAAASVAQLKVDLQEAKSSLKSLSTAMVASLMRVRCHVTVQQERSRRLSKDNQMGTVAHLQKCVEELRIKCREEETRRRLIFNVLQEQVGNIRVYCRCTHVDGEQAVETIGSEIVRMRGQQDEYFRFDRVFGVGSQQSALFEEFKPLIASFMDGFNVCFIAYGGEASGKTYTLHGLPGQQQHEGLVQRSLTTVLKEADKRSENWSFDVSVVCLEVYNDSYYDLLAGRAHISLYHDCGLGSVFNVMKQMHVAGEKDVASLLRVSASRRRVANTALNPKSSRSHLIHLVRLQGRSRVHGESTCSYLALMDLAGAENILKANTWNDAARSAEAGHINKSLAAFNRLFLTLRKTPPSSACYREAKLTQMLKQFVVNHGKCCLIITVRSDQGSVSTTMSTLRFGKDARQVALGKAQKQLVALD